MAIPAVGVIYGALTYIAGEGIYKAIRWALVSLGIGVAAYFVTDSLVSSIFSYVQSEFNGMPSDLIKLAGVFGVDVMINYLLAYSSMLITYSALSKRISGGSKSS